MQVQSGIEQKLLTAFSPVRLEVINESGNHNVPQGSESHFKVVIVADAFTGQNLVAKHRAVNEVLAAELAGPVHALSIHAHTPEQWTARGGEIPDSPLCRGGSKA